MFSEQVSVMITGQVCEGNISANKASYWAETWPFLNEGTAEKREAHFLIDVSKLSSKPKRAAAKQSLKILYD